MPTGLSANDNVILCVSHTHIDSVRTSSGASAAMAGGGATIAAGSAAALCEATSVP